jgi:hypothetical protein
VAFHTGQRMTPMISASVLLLASLICLTLWLSFAHVADRRQLQQQTEIAARGQYCQGRVLAVQRPFLFESATRLYFEFAPPGTDRPIQCCHTERRPAAQLPTSLPSAGTLVTVQYLPENPGTAAIGNLLRRVA